MMKSHNAPAVSTALHVSRDQQRDTKALPGVHRAEQAAQYLTPTYRVIIFTSIFLLGFSYGFASLVNAVYHSYATASFGQHSLLATASTLRLVFAVAAQPTAARLADVFGRFEIMFVSAVLFILGLIVQATSKNVAGFVAGGVLNQMGLSTTQVLVQITVADFTSTRSRLFFYCVPNLHFIATTWLSGNMTSSFLKHSTWRWGIAMWCFVYAACSLLFILSLWLAQRHPCASSGTATLADNGNALTRESLWNFDHPSVWGALGIALFFNFAASLQRGFLYTVLVVAFDFSVAAAARINSVYSFMAFATGPLTGLVVYRVRRLKPFIIAGTTLFTVAFGLLIRYRGGEGTPEKAGIIAGQVLLGFGGGLFAYAASVAMQSELAHDQVAVMIALYMAAHNVGNSFGSSVSGVIWNQVLPKTLASNLAFQSNETPAMTVFANPFAAAAQYPAGTEVRTAIMESNKHVQKLLCITGICLCIPLLVFSAVIKNSRLTDEQTLAMNPRGPQPQQQEDLDTLDNKERRGGEYNLGVRLN
ncbi:hypothetical protein CEP54_008212 [Fusarium duplospermum]|uniref:Major facilitator superfamily (MFS) profile domain-containing protein n=1 Tax=Fusarium duplospermum TaxID=1325734 RepID=A0A428PX71_9HYPO|nr:hypothetical protein CEP54_008212 [Fusarium duplospermum]